MSLLGNLLYTLWLFLPGSAVGLKVNQTPSTLTLLRGQTARICCSLLSGDERLDSVRYYWTRTRDNPVNGSRNFLKNSSRISLSGKEGWLVIRDVTMDDSDNYRCSALRMDPSHWKTYFGNGTEVTIRAKPDVSLSPDRKSEAAGVQTLICVAAGFFPKDLNISWTITGDVSYETDADPLTVNEDQTYNLSSRLRVTDSRRESVSDISCLVYHVTGSVRRSFTFSPGSAVGLKVNQTPSTLTLLRGQTARICCSLLSGDERLDSVRYSWTRTRDNPVNGSRNFLKNGARISLSGKEGWLVIREVTMDDSDTYRCPALRMDSNPWKTYFGNGTEVTIRAKPDVSLSLDRKSEAAGVQTLICVAAGFFPKDLNISWTVTGDVSYETDADPLTVNEDQTYNLSSRLRVTDSGRESVPDISCLVYHVTGSARRSFTFSPDDHLIPFILHAVIIIVGVSLLLLIVITFSFAGRLRHRKGCEDQQESAW